MAIHRPNPGSETKKSRQDWILQYIRDNGSASFGDEPFFNAFIRTTGVHHRPDLKGSNRCYILAQDLAEMLQDGRLTAVRERGPVAGKGGWMYRYSLAPELVR
jgi:hypothetical protein